MRNKKIITFFQSILIFLLVIKVDGKSEFGYHGITANKWHPLLFIIALIGALLSAFLEFFKGFILIFKEIYIK